ncbi:hypothetical protein HMPREF0645_2125 [Hallella bergensis DSM 17361]|uniref:DUF4270 domain-containing protein n=1 Tax=Hallella bergensis DSM 17361 TaxID=585502 RepID=D1PYU0_9BACT|nr:DUF4270 domain-containing protein [Hallella bergensis]EFA43447.1 hypothetical protein HMPREF0645_2125 [Hallella bergensis DSM 17361]
MNSKLLVSIALVCFAFMACDDTTDNIGASLTQSNDGVSVQAATFDVVSQSIKADSVLSRNVTGHLGKVRDPETGAYVTGNFMAQFNNVEGFDVFPPLDHLVTYDSDGKPTYGNKGIIMADSCELRLFVKNYYGDDKQNMKITAYEMDKPMNENRLYYSNFDPIEKGYIRDNGIHLDKVYNLTDYNISKNERDSMAYKTYITLKLNDKYTDRNNKSYTNYGSYILQKYYDNSSYFKNALTFRNHVVPGFYFKLKSGLGNMADITSSQLNVYFKFKTKYAYVDSTSGKAIKMYRDTVYRQVAVFWGTEEVLQTSNIINDPQTIDKLVADESCTYLKTPAGIFTELTLPVNEIMQEHTNDSIVSAKIIIPRLNNKVDSKYALNVPQNILMVPKDSLYSFFEQNKLYNNKTSYLATWAYKDPTHAKDNSYTFNNIAGLIAAMNNNKGKSENWNKVVLVPVALATTKTSSATGSGTTTTITKLSNEMSLTSTRLMKGTEKNSPIKISVIYSRFK